MKIETKFDVGDTIFFEGLNKTVQEATVFKIETTCCVRSKDTIHIYYITSGNVHLSPEKVFPTKEILKLKLIKDIIKE